MNPNTSSMRGVYPRVGGGTGHPLLDKRRKEGLSPRGRGNRRGYRFIQGQSGSIPAWAGEPDIRCLINAVKKVYPRVGGGTGLEPEHIEYARGLSPRGRGNPNRHTLRLMPVKVYPRVGGGTFPPAHRRPPLHGLSPRGRGNLDPLAQRRLQPGSIPAWAGEPTTETLSFFLSRVYPRVGGGTVSCSLLPRPADGLSPRGRGNLQHLFNPFNVAGSIPAWAGEPTECAQRRAGRKVYPRVGGGTDDIIKINMPRTGLSPRGRGNPVALVPKMVRGGSIPAWAGEPELGQSGSSSRRVYPRVGGGTNLCNKMGGPPMGLSPRGRGNRMIRAGAGRGPRSIPAWAGEPYRTGRDTSVPKVYPRVGGGTHAWTPLKYLMKGLSPRGRGNHRRSFHIRLSIRSIPAWAGEP